MKLLACFGHLCRWILLILLSQCIAIFQTSTGVFSVLLDGIDFHFPTFQNTALYFSLIAVFLPVLILLAVFGRRELNLAILAYVVIGFFDVQGNLLAVAAYHFVPLTSVLLLTQATMAPIIILLSIIFLRRSYSFLNFVGCGFCVVGSTILVLSDVSGGAVVLSGSSIWRTLGGDALALLSSFCYCLCNVCEEFALKKVSVKESRNRNRNRNRNHEANGGESERDSDSDSDTGCGVCVLSCLRNSIEYFAFVGLFGAIFNLIEVCVLGEVKHVAKGLVRPGVVPYLLGYAGVLFCFYLAVPVLIASSSATFYSVSSLTSNAFGVVARGLFRIERVEMRPLYYVALASSVLGICVYAAGGESKSQSRKKNASSPTHEAEGETEVEGAEGLEVELAVVDYASTASVVLPS